MIGRIFTVGGLTLVSRLTGFARDIVLAAVLGAGPVADAFFVALRLPNHFRAIFAEGAFNAAFVPAYARIRKQSGADGAGIFADRVFTLLLASQVVLLAAALLFTPTLITLLAPGFTEDALRFGLAVERRLQADAVTEALAVHAVHFITDDAARGGCDAADGRCRGVAVGKMVATAGGGRTGEGGDCDIDGPARLGRRDALPTTKLSIHSGCLRRAAGIVLEPMAQMAAPCT